METRPVTVHDKIMARARNRDVTGERDTTPTHHGTE
jgi:hypothetical protein